MNENTLNTLNLPFILCEALGVFSGLAVISPEYELSVLTSFPLAIAERSPAGVTILNTVVNANQVPVSMQAPHHEHQTALRWLPAPCPVAERKSDNGNTVTLLQEWVTGEFCSSESQFSLDSIRCASRRTAPIPSHFFPAKQNLADPGVSVHVRCGTFCLPQSQSLAPSRSDIILSPFNTLVSSSITLDGQWQPATSCTRVATGTMCQTWPASALSYRHLQPHRWARMQACHRSNPALVVVVKSETRNQGMLPPRCLGVLLSPIL